MYGVTRESIRRIEVKALNKLRYPGRVRRAREYVGDDYNVGMYDSEIEYDKLKDPNQIVDKIKIEPYKLGQEKTKEMSKFEAEPHGYSEEEFVQSEVREKIHTNDEEENMQLENGEKQKVQPENDKNNTQDTYLDEISELLGELDELDAMLKQTSSEIKEEKGKKKKNEELRAKMKKVEDMIQGWKR